MALINAHAVAERTVLTARAEGQRFIVLLAEAGRSRSLTMCQLYIESLKDLLAQVKNKLILSPGDAVDLTVLGVKEESSRSAPEPIVSDPLQPAEPREKK